MGEGVVFEDAFISAYNFQSNWIVCPGADLVKSALEVGCLCLLPGAGELLWVLGGKSFFNLVSDLNWISECLVT